jgi:hypothetical protein
MRFACPDRKITGGSTFASSVGAQAPNDRCSRQALFGCGFAAMVVACLQLN